MAKSTNVIVRLISSAGTGYCYYVKRNTRNSIEKFVHRKYDPIVRKHVDFKEVKMPSHSKK